MKIIIFETTLKQHIMKLIDSVKYNKKDQRE